MNMEIRKIIDAGSNTIQLAANRKLAVCLTVVDQGGHVVYQARMDGANFMTNEVSYLKAKTAFLFKCPSHVLRTITEKVPVLNHTIQLVPGDACMLEGGLPIKLGDNIVGGVGVSGGNFDEDLAVATAFVDFLASDGNQS
jgi:glc operon protein GlcG